MKHVVKPVQDIHPGDQFWSAEGLNWTARQDPVVVQEEVHLVVQFRDGGLGRRVWDLGTTLGVEVPE